MHGKLVGHAHSISVSHVFDTTVKTVSLTLAKIFMHLYFWDRNLEAVVRPLLTRVQPGQGTEVLAFLVRDILTVFWWQLYGICALCISFALFICGALVIHVNDRLHSL